MDWPGMGEKEIAQQIREHLNCLRLAGVEWVPNELLIDSGKVLTSELPEPEKLTLSENQTSTMNREIEVGALASLQPINLEQRKQELKVLSESVSACTRCPELVVTRTQTVFGVGPVGADLCFIGEAPGADEDAQGEPFVGAAGKLLNRIILACNLKREEVYICNIIKCRPPGNRTPLPQEAGNCRKYLEEQLELVKPRFICALGGTAAQNLLQTTVPLGRLRRHFHDYKGIPVICTYHPAYLLPHRNPGMKKEVWEDMKMLLERMGRPIPSS